LIRVGELGPRLTQEVGAARQSTKQGLFTSPPSDTAMVTAEQNLGDAVLSEGVRTCVLRVFEQCFGKALIHCRGRIAKHARTQTHDGIEHDEGSGLTTCQHIIANRKFLVDEMLTNAFINTFVTTTDEHQVVMTGQVTSDGLGKRLTLRREQNTMGATMVALDGFDRTNDRAWFHDHARTTTIRRVIGAAMAVVGMIADIVNANLKRACLTCSMNNRGAEW